MHGGAGVRATEMDHPPPIAIPAPNAHRLKEQPAPRNGKTGAQESPAASSLSPNGVRNFRDVQFLTAKAASLVGKGLPWPEASASVHDNKNMVRTEGVPWMETVRPNSRMNCNMHSILSLCI